MTKTPFRVYPYTNQIQKNTITKKNQLPNMYIFSFKLSSFNALTFATKMLFLHISPLHWSCSMFIPLTNSLHRSCTEFKFLSRPGMMALDLAHIGGSSHPINPQTESFIGHAKNLLPGFRGVQDVFTTTTFPQKHSTIFVVAELKKKKGRRKETLGKKIAGSGGI